MSRASAWLKRAHRLLDALLLGRRHLAEHDRRKEQSARNYRRLDAAVKELEDRCSTIHAEVTSEIHLPNGGAAGDCAK